MLKSFVYLLLATLVVFGTTGCSLFGSSDDEESAEVAESSEFEKDEFEEGGEISETEEISTADELEGEFPDDESFEEAPGEIEEEVVGDASAEEFSTEEFPDDSDSVTEEMALDNEQVASIGDEIPADESFEEEVPSETLTENADQEVFTEDYVDDPSETISEEYYEDSAPFEEYVPVKTYVSVKKMKPSSFQRAGANVNRLYVVRPGDNMSSIGKKIYGSDRSKDLYSWNGHFVGKSLKVGDKIYYNSPRNPGDKAMKTFYDDAGVSPQFYNAKAGENIRGIAKKLLGHERSWMEIYATNENLESKGRLPTAINLKYWNGNNVPPPAPKMAEREAEPEPPDEDFDAEEEEIADLEEGEVPEDPNLEELSEPEEEFDDEVADNDEPEVKPPPVSTGSVAPPPPPPSVKPPPVPPAPKPIAKAPPAPPTKSFSNSINKFKNQLQGKVGGAKVKGKNKVKTLGLLIAVAVIGMLLLLFSIRRGRSKRVNFTHTQV